MADILPIKANKQSKVNRIWRFINKSKLFKPKHIYQVITKIVFKLTKQNKIIIDFTSLKGWNIKLLIISVPFISRSLPIYAKTLFLSDIYNMKYKSENEFIKKCILEFIEIMPQDLKGNLIIFADRQFATKEFIKFFIENNLRFVMRIKEKVKVEIDGKEILIKNLKEGFYEVKIDGKQIKLYKKKDKKDNMVIITTEDLKTVKKAVKTYLRRSLCENMHRDLKQRIDILFLNKNYYKNLTEEKVNKYLVLFILTHLFGMLIGYKAKRNKEIYRKFISHKKEKSLFNLGQLVVIDGLVDFIGVDISNFLKRFLLSDYR